MNGALPKPNVPSGTPSGSVGSPTVLLVDGDARGEPGHAAAGVVLLTTAAEPIAEDCVYLGRMTGSAAAYQALIRGLQLAGQRAIRDIEIRTSSELMVRQIRGEQPIRNPSLSPLHQMANRLLRSFRRWDIQALPRAELTRPVELVEAELDRRDGVRGRPRPLPSHPAPPTLVGPVGSAVSVGAPSAPAHPPAVPGPAAGLGELDSLSGSMLGLSLVGGAEPSHPPPSPAAPAAAHVGAAHVGAAHVGAAHVGVAPRRSSDTSSGRIPVVAGSPHSSAGTLNAVPSVRAEVLKVRPRGPGALPELAVGATFDFGVASPAGVPLLLLAGLLPHVLAAQRGVLGVPTDVGETQVSCTTEQAYYLIGLRVSR